MLLHRPLTKSLVILACAGFVASCARTVPAPVYDGSRWASAAGPERPEPVVQPFPGMIEVRSGDTLIGLARTYNTTANELAAHNKIAFDSTLREGQMLRLPAPRLHTVSRGDTALGISKAHDVPFQSLVELNGLKEPYDIKVGQRLVLPARGAWTPATQVATGSISRTAKVQDKPVAGVRPSTKPQAAGFSPGPAVKPLFNDRSGFVWPVNGQIVSTFGATSNGLHNDGINIAVASGTPVVAAQSGVVTYAGNELKGYGNLLLIQHDNGYITAYAHNARMFAKRGDRVERGQKIAEVGRTGDVKSSQLHFEIRKGRQALNPLDFLSGA